MSQQAYLPGLPTQNVQVFTATSPSATNRHSQIWHKPRNASMLYIDLYGPGGNGGLGAVGANSTAAGGGGGGSGGRSTLLVPLSRLPDVLYVTVGQGGSGLGCSVGIAPTPIASSLPSNYLLLVCGNGGNGGNAAGATAGAAGAAAGLSTIAGCNLAGLGMSSFLGGQAGIIGGTTVAGAALTLPVTGLNVTGGTGGGGLPAAATSGTAGGNITGVAVTGTIYEAKTILGGAAPAAGTTPPGNGGHGFSLVNFYYLGGTGGASTHGTATGAGLVKARGGDGAIGCGGGGSGGALTGSTAAPAGRGGDGQAIFCWW